MADNIIEDIVVPDNPSTVPGEQHFIFVPIATNVQKGIAAFDPNMFVVINGMVYLKVSYLDSNYVKTHGTSSIVAGDNDLAQLNVGSFIILGGSGDNAGKIKGTIGEFVNIIVTNGVDATAVTPEYFKGQLGSSDDRSNIYIINLNASGSITVDGDATIRDVFVRDITSERNIYAQNITATGRIYGVIGASNNKKDAFFNYVNAQRFFGQVGSSDNNAVGYFNTAYARTVNAEALLGPLGLSNVNYDAYIKKLVVKDVANFESNIVMSAGTTLNGATIIASVLNVGARSVGAYLNKVDDIEEKIPSQASSSNQLADKDFVNSSISTNTAHFLGTFDLVTDLGLTSSATHTQVAAALKTVIEGETNNDYVNVKYTVDNDTFYDRYTYNADDEEFKYNFTINTTTFTAEQWAAINSGATLELIGQITTNKTDINNIKPVIPSDANEGNKLTSNATVNTTVDNKLVPYMTAAQTKTLFINQIGSTYVYDKLTFIVQVQTGQTITLHLQGQGTIWWGDGSSQTFDTVSPTIFQHPYNAQGVYTIYVEGATDFVIGSDSAQVSGFVSVSIPSTFSVISDNAFRNCAGLLSVMIPSSISVVGDNAFGYDLMGERSLKEVFFKGSADEFEALITSSEFGDNNDALTDARKYYLTEGTAVQFVVQNLSSSQKEQARQNIGAQEAGSYVPTTRKIADNALSSDISKSILFNSLFIVTDVTVDED